MYNVIRDHCQRGRRECEGDGSFRGFQRGWPDRCLYREGHWRRLPGLDGFLQRHHQLSADQLRHDRTDFFYTTVRPDGNHQWWYFYYHQNPFAVGSTKLAYDSTPPDQLRFGDFNGDGVTDVFKLVQRCQVYIPVLKR